MSDALKTLIEDAWENRSGLSAESPDPDLVSAVEAVIEQLDAGTIRVASPTGGEWVVHEWLKKAILLSFRLSKMTLIPGAPNHASWWDKVLPKFSGWAAEEFAGSGFRAVPPCTVRQGAYIAPDVVLMPSFVNIGAYVGRGTMVDTWATIGSCAQIGERCHISGGTGIGGVLEPLQAQPVIIEDDCFIGARSEVAEGVRVCQGAVLSMGVYLGASTRIIDRETGQIFRGYVPPYSVVVPGNLPGRPLPGDLPGPSLYCAVIVKRVDAQTRSKVAINDLLRPE
jgi:2,3,4,5-tetrahydropyridine-2-carboxylate N-succinyltransferase